MVVQPPGSSMPSSSEPSVPAVLGRRAAELAGDSLIVGTTVLGLVTARAGERAGSLILGLALGGLVVRLLLDRPPGGRSTLPLGTRVTLRALVITATGVVLSASRPSPGQALVAAVATALLVGLLVSERLLSRAARFRPRVVAHLPGVPPSPSHRDFRGAVVWASLAVTAVGVALAVLGGWAGWWLAAAAVATAPSLAVAVVGRAKILYARRTSDLVSEAFAAYAPEFVVYTSRPDDASYQVAMWLPYLQRTGRRFCVITRNATPAAALAALTDVPVVEARRITDLDSLVPPSLQAAFYVNASSGNGAFVRYQHLTHIYLGHGDSDKPPSYNPTHAMYDRIFLAGPAAARRYAAHGVKIPAEKFQVVGRPQVEDIRGAADGAGRRSDPVVLYAPTWRGHVEETRLYSLPEGERIVAALLNRGVTVMFRPHPFSYDFPEDAASIRRIHSRLAANARATGRKHLWGPAAEAERSILDCINASDAMVSDVSSVVSDYLFSGKPFAMVAVPADPDTFVRDYPAARAAYVVRGDLTDLGPVLDRMLGPDPLAAARAAVRVDYLGDFPAASYAAAFVDAVRQVSSKAVTGEFEEPLEVADTPGDPAGGELEDQNSSPDFEVVDHGVDDGGSSTPSVPGGNRSRWAGYWSLVRRPALALSATAAATLALGAALLAGPPPITALLGLLALGLGLWSAASTLRRPARWHRLLTHSGAARAVLLTTLAALSGAGISGGGDPVALTAAFMLVGVVLVAEGHVRSAWGPIGLEARDFPQAGAEMAELVPRGVVALAGFGWLAICFLLAAVNLPGWLALALALVVVALSIDVVFRAFLRAGRVVSAGTGFRRALAEYEPEFAVYFASTVGGAYQVGMWLPYFVRIGRPFIIVTRTLPMLGEITRTARAMGSAVPVVYRPTLRSVEELIVPSLRAAFYVNNAVRNTHFVERREVVHVWLNHGDSEKPACYNPVHAIYDRIFVAGQAGIDRYARHGVNIPPDKFWIVGRPQVEAIELARGRVSEKQPPTVLYAPTWQGPFADSRVYSLPQGRAIVAHLLECGARVIFRSHPFNYRYRESVAMIAEIGALLDADRERTGRGHLWGAAAEQEMGIEECFNASDAMVCDVSAVVSDYLRSDKPFCIVSVGRAPEQLLADVPAARAAYVLREDLSNLAEVTVHLLRDDPLARERHQTRLYYLGDFGEDPYANGFLNAARRVIDAGSVSPGTESASESRSVSGV